MNTNSKPTLKILAVSLDYPFPEHTNGITKLVAHIASPSPNEGYETDICCAYLPSRQDHLDPPVECLGLAPPPRWLSNLVWMFSLSPLAWVRHRAAWRALGSYVQGTYHDYDVIHWYGITGAAVVARATEEVRARSVVSAIDSLSLYYQAKSACLSGVRRLVMRVEFVKAQAFEKRYLPAISRLTVVAPKDRAQIKRSSPGDVLVIPNGVDTEYFKPQTGEEQGRKPDRLVFTGWMSYGPNHDAALFLLQEIMPLLWETYPTLKCVIAGKEPKEALRALEEPRVRITGFLEDMRTVLSPQAIYICPLRFGSGMKNKILEAGAMGLPIVSSSLGVDGICEQGSYPELRVVEDFRHPASYAREVRDLLERPVHPAGSSSFREYVADTFSWAAVRQDYHALYRRNDILGE